MKPRQSRLVQEAQRQRLRVLGIKAAQPGAVKSLRPRNALLRVPFGPQPSVACALQTIGAGALVYLMNRQRSGGAR